MLFADRAVPPRPAGRLRQAVSFSLSAGIHGAVFAWVALGPAAGPPPKTIYQQVIEPNRERIVWYNLKDKLPDVAPRPAAADPRPPRVRRRAGQTLVSDMPERRNLEQTIWLPEAAETDRPLESPNVIAIREKAPPRAFVPPERRLPPMPAPVLPETPQLASTSLVPAPVTQEPAKPRPRDFTPPDTKPFRPKPATLPEAPQVASTSLVPAPVTQEPAKPRPRDFTPPDTKPSRPKPATLPEAPQVASTSLAPAPVTQEPAKPRPRDFTPPERRLARQAPAALPEAPQLASTSLVPAPVQSPIARPRRDFVPPTPSPSRPSPSTLPDAPQIASTSLAPAPLSTEVARPRPRTFTPPAPSTRNAAPATLPDTPQTPQTALASLSPAPFSTGVARPRPRDFVVPLAPAAPSPSTLPAPTAAEAGRVTAVIVSPHPALHVEVPDPAAALRAGFSAGPATRSRNAGNGSEPGALLTVPGLTVRGGTRDTAPTMVARVLEAPTSRQNLAAAARAAPRSPVEEQPHNRSVRLSSAPDPRLEGRVVYTIAVQMPNITSFSGSWIFWFAERESQPGAPPDIAPPAPLRKVDPKYFPAAMDARLEGKVRLAAVIRRTGRVEAVSMISGFDPGLDRSAAEALGKWEFEPARRDGNPVDVDTVVEIPFRLAPRIAK